MKQQHQLFVANYIRTQSATKAALAAGYSAHTASTQGSRLLKRLDIQGAIAQHDAKIQKSNAITADRVIAELGKIAFFNIQDILDEHNKVKPIKDLPPDVAAALQSIETGKDFTKVRAASKLDSLGTLAKIIGLTKEREQQTAIQVVLLQDKPALDVPAVEVRQLNPQF